MKTKTRHIIGNTLVWSGLLLLAYGLFNMITFYKSHFGLNGECVVDNSFNIIIQSIAIVALLIGGLWGMKK